MVKGLVVMRSNTQHWNEARAKGRPGNCKSALASLEAICDAKILQFSANGLDPSPKEKYSKDKTLPPSLTSCTRNLNGA